MYTIPAVSKKVYIGVWLDIAEKLELLSHWNKLYFI